MMQNLKIDIIYYETPSDFEFEFNLGGCCHCRVLNNSTSSPKELVSCLSKAVGRSRVIIIVGNLNQPNGLYLLISKAIGHQLTNVSADEYGIAPDSNTTIIEGALPLVSSDGLLSGCVIESGPQSIILLPDEKSLRKDVAENLVFQYISALSRTPETDSVILPDSEPEKQESITEDVEEVMEEATLPSEEIINEIEEESREEETETDEECNEEEVLTELEEASGEIEEETENSEASDQESEDIKEIVIPDKEDNFFDIFAEQTEENASNDFVYSDTIVSSDDDSDDYENAKPSKDKSMNILIWLIIGLMFIILGVLAYMLIYTPLKNGVNITDYVRQIFNQ